MLEQEQATGDLRVWCLTLFRERNENSSPNRARILPGGRQVFGGKDRPCRINDIAAFEEEAGEVHGIVETFFKMRALRAVRHGLNNSTPPEFNIERVAECGRSFGFEPVIAFRTASCCWQLNCRLQSFDRRSNASLLFKRFSTLELIVAMCL